MLLNFFTAILFWTVVNLARTQAKCYNTRGIENGDLACDPSTTNSACCAPTFVCLDNGLCAPGPNTSAAGYQTITDFYRGSCTDSGWKSGACPKFCLSEDDSPSGQGLNACQGEGVGKYCCWRSGTDCCQNSTAIIDLGAANIRTTIGFSPSSSTTLSSTRLQHEPPTSIPNSSSHGSSVNNISIGAGIGLGIRVPLLVGIVAMIVWFRKRAARTSQSTQSGSGDSVKAKAELDITAMLDELEGNRNTARELDGERNMFRELEGEARTVYEL